jgi:sugar diacid utilization regulator
MINTSNISPPRGEIFPIEVPHNDLQWLLTREIFGTLTQYRPLRITLDAIARVIRCRFGFHSCSILLKRAEESLLFIEGSAGLSANYTEAVNHRYRVCIEDLKFSEGPSSQAFLTGHPVIVEDTEISPIFQRWRILARQEGMRSLIALPLPVHNSYIGTLVCYQRQPHNYHDHEIRFLEEVAAQVGAAVEIASSIESQQKTIRSLEERIKELHAVEQRMRYSFAGDLITGGYDDVKQVQDRGRYLGYDLRGPFQVLVFDFDRIDHSEGDDGLTEMDVETLYQRLFRAMEHAARTCGLSALITHHRGQIVMVLLGTNKASGKAKERAVAVIRRTVCQLSSGLSVSIGAGQIYAQLEQICNSYREATHALQVIRRLGGREKMLTYSELGVTRLLFQVENAAVLIDYARTRLQSVLAYDQQHNGVLMQALEAYLAANQSVPLAAQRLDLHANTFRYRLRKIEELVGASLNSTALLLDLQLACLILRIIDTEAIELR